MSSAKVKRVATVCTVVALLGFAVILLALILPSIRGATGPNLTTGWGLPAGMVAIPGGTNAGIEPGEGPERVEYNLTVKPFWMDEKEVTRELWDEIRIWSNGKGYSYDNTGSAKAVNHPVQKVDWFDCVKWCNARSEKSGFEPVYYTDQVFSTVYRTGSHVPHVKKSANGFRLPTADEWQYAARGGERSHRFPWKDAETIQHVRANYFSMGNPKNKMQPLLSSDTNSTRGFHPKYAVDPKPYTSPVGSFPPNGYGLFDMIGNASEWCFDVAFYPTGRVDRTRRTCCGGGWASVGYSIARSRTFSLPTLFPPEGLPFPSLSESDVGFRTVKEPD